MAGIQARWTTTVLPPVTSSTVSINGSTGLTLEASVAVARQQNAVQREEGQALVRLIESAAGVVGGPAPGTTAGAVGELIDLIA